LTPIPGESIGVTGLLLLEDDDVDGEAAEIWLLLLLLVVAYLACIFAAAIARVLAEAFAD
jgi:hypothetical protein